MKYKHLLVAYGERLAPDGGLSERGQDQLSAAAEHIKDHNNNGFTLAGILCASTLVGNESGILIRDILCLPLRSSDALAYADQEPSDISDIKKIMEDETAHNSVIGDRPGGLVIVCSKLAIAKAQNIPPVLALNFVDGSIHPF